MNALKQWENEWKPLIKDTAWTILRRSGEIAGVISLWMVKKFWSFVMNKWVKRILMLIILGIIAIGLATLIYGVFYWFYIPELRHECPLHFQFDPRSKTSKFPHKFPPKAHIDFPDCTLELPFDEAFEPPDNILYSGQAYSIAVDLNLPDMDVNHDLGIFMVSAALLGTDGTTVFNVSRSVMMRHRSWLIRHLKTAILAVPMVLGIVEESEMAHIQLANGFVDSLSKPVVSADVTISDSRLRLYSGRLSLVAELTGLKFLLHRWFLTSAVVGIGMLSTIIYFSSLLVWVVFYLWRRRGGPGPKEGEEEEEEVSSEVSEEEIATWSARTPISPMQVVPGVEEEEEEVHEAEEEEVGELGLRRRGRGAGVVESSESEKEVEKEV